jgi:mRNA interferase RelE/StbE
VGTGKEEPRPVAPPYRIEIKSSARKALASLPRPMQRRVQARIDELARNPRPIGVKQLKGPEAFLRIRVGDYRVVYAVHDDVLVVLVIRIAHRREAYRPPIA